MITMDPPTIIRAQIRDKQKIKAVLKLSFSSDPLVRWVFPDPNMYLKFFDIWMEEFSKISFSENIVFAEDNKHKVINIAKDQWKQSSDSSPETN